MSNALDGVSCPSPAECIAVGFDEQKSGVFRTLAERWNGHDWAIQRSANPGGANDTEFSSVSCPAVAACVAVGDYGVSSTSQTMLAESWNGRRWSTQPVSNPQGALGGELVAVACHSATTCTAVGDFTNSTGDVESLAERWNGKHWVIQPTAAPPGGGTSGALVAVRCPSAASCIAVGDYDSSSDVGKTLAQHWNGKHWTFQHTPNPPS